MEISDLVYIDATGYHYADYPAFLQWRQEQYRAIYGADVYLEADSQDGELLAVQARADYQTAILGAAVFNSFSPVTAQGAGLARVVKINGIRKQSPSYSTCSVVIVGQADTVITNGVVIDALEQKWDLPATVTIPSGGTITVTATAQVIGAVEAAANTITGIFTPTLGWQTVNNVLAATPGSPVETDAELRVRQAESTALPAQTLLDGTEGAVLNVAGVTKARAYENDTDTTDSNGLPEHSFSVVVAGGDDTEIANAINIRKGPGPYTYGDTAVLVYDTRGMPLTIRFQRAVTATIGVRVTLSAETGWTTDYEQLIKEAVAEFVNSGLIGKTLLLSKFFAPAYLYGTEPGQTYDISLIELKKNGGAFADANVTLDWDENPVCDPDTDVVLVVT